MNLMRNRKAIAGLAMLALGVAFLVTAASAQETQQGTGQPARAVRLSFVDGQVKLAQGNQVLAAQAVANTPLFEGMQLTTADNGKAEIQFEDGSVARLAPDSTLTLQVLRGAGTSADAELTLNSGLCYFEFQGGDQAGQMSVHFGSSVATTSGFTALRVAMDTPPGSLAVFSGNVHLQVASATGAASATDLHGGESITLNPADPSQNTLAESIEPNSWDAWNSDRDQALTAEAAAQTGAPENLGETQNPAWNDLDANGSWYDVPGQGYIWSPYEAANADFDPYGNGEWMYTPSYGYVWASGYSWGYMPYQCGAWNFYNGFGWGWAPGMGGCRPWWGLGFYGGPNIGYAPIGYRPIPRPLPPHGPIGHRPIPMIPVNRHTALVNTRLPARDKNAQVTIAGSTVQALHPLPSRPVYSHEGFTSETNRTTPGNAGAGTSRPPATPGSSFTGSRPAGGTVPTPSYTPPPRPAPAPSYTPPPRPVPEPRSTPAPSYSPPRSSSNGGGSSHSSGGGSSHSSGSSGGGSHSSGGGGGGSHSSGGGGGGSHGHR
jgi:ferric-dicitrate binding protein FerR (iron transport regulator)